MAVHNVILVALTHTPGPMNFITKALGRNENERPMHLIPSGYPAKNAQAHHILRKSEEDITEYYH